jgi:hypothetical protein
MIHLLNPVYATQVSGSMPSTTLDPEASRGRGSTGPMPPRRWMSSPTPRTGNRVPGTAHYQVQITAGEGANGDAPHEVRRAGECPDHAGLGRRPLPFEASIPGVFAVGDVHSGSMKQVAAATGEGASAIASVHNTLV